jgi:hypothetical protein
MKQRFLRRKTRKHIEISWTSATEQRELVQAKEKPWAQSAMGAVKGARAALRNKSTPNK